MPRELKQLVTDLDVVKTWFSPGSSRHNLIARLADELAEHAGGRETPSSGDPNLATPGPGVRTPVVTEVDSVGQVEDKPAQSAADAAVGAGDPIRLGQSAGTSGGAKLTS